ncbi:MAG: hypothetical protein HYZ57_17405 [Acidobacteria bacterium]|nr:hypothetical protein [Acidobacteriota bacterium]MBI3281607.1 hypothetical protein [Acidobacteriota bacterium]
MHLSTEGAGIRAAMRGRDVRIGPAVLLEALAGGLQARDHRRLHAFEKELAVLAGAEAVVRKLLP